MESTETERPVIRTARDAADLLGPMVAGAATERLAFALLDSQQRLIATGEAGELLVASVELPVRRILTEALKADAAALIVAHNHPSEVAEPSSTDRAATRVLAEAAAQLGIRLCDHLIFAGAECRSMRGLGLL